VTREIAGEIGPDRLRRLHGAFRANRQALNSYEPRPYPGSVVLVEGDSPRTWFELAPADGWRRLARGGVTTYRIPGDHYTIIQQPAVHQVAEIIAREIQHRQETGRETRNR
jgi:thioesterase domain-containing protein